MKHVLCILILICGCKHESTTQTSGTADSTTASVIQADEPRQQKPSAGGAEVSFQFEDDDIGGSPFVKDFDAIMRSLHDFSIAKRVFRNPQDSTRTDTLLTVTFGESSIDYYKLQSGGRGFIIGATIASNDVEFKKGIRIGMNDTDFFAMFAELKGKTDLGTVVISTLEGLNQTEFEFVGGKLSAVRYQSYFD